MTANREQWQELLSRQRPRTAIVLGSGLGLLPSCYREIVSVPYEEVPHLRRGTVLGHASRLSLGDWDGVPVLLCLGRLHLYEGCTLTEATALVRMVSHLQIQRVILTNAAGSLDRSLTPGMIMIICAHYKLIGKDAWRQMLRGRPETEPYAGRLRERLPSVIPCGVYAAVTGPCYETPAEVRALARCGARAVGMSTAWEAEEAHRLGLEVVALSYITNFATGIEHAVPHHDEVLSSAQQGRHRLYQLLRYLVD